MNLERAEILARLIVRKHLPPAWRFAWHNGTTCAGICSFDTKKVLLSKGITAVTPARYVRWTVLHEVAHALTSREKAHHGERWAEKCRELGCPDREGLTPHEDRLRELARKTARTIRTKAQKKRGARSR